MFVLASFSGPGSGRLSLEWPDGHELLLGHRALPCLNFWIVWIGEGIADLYG